MPKLDRSTARGALVNGPCEGATAALQQLEACVDAGFVALIAEQRPDLGAPQPGAGAQCRHDLVGSRIAEAVAENVPGARLRVFPDEERRADVGYADLLRVIEQGIEQRQPKHLGRAS